MIILASDKRIGCFGAAVCALFRLAERIQYEQFLSEKSRSKTQSVLLDPFYWWC